MHAALQLSRQLIARMVQCGGGSRAKAKSASVKICHEFDALEVAGSSSRIALCKLSLVVDLRR